MDKEPPKKRLFRTLIFPIGFATLVAGMMMMVIPEVGAYAAASAWIGIVLVLGVWGSFRSNI